MGAPDSSSSNRLKFAWATLAVSLVGWPVSAWAIEVFPKAFEHIVLAISWLAITYTAYDIITTTNVREQVESDE